MGDFWGLVNRGLPRGDSSATARKAKGERKVAVNERDSSQPADVIRSRLVGSRGR